MPGEPERTAREWFEEAERAYVELHQACASCGGRHQVYKGRRGNRLEYYCPACDFFAFRDDSNGLFYAVAGRDVPQLPPTVTASHAQATAL
jgi:hypothetical protein